MYTYKRNLLLIASRSLTAIGGDVIIVKLFEPLDITLRSLTAIGGNVTTRGSFLLAWKIYAYHTQKFTFSSLDN